MRQAGGSAALARRLQCVAWLLACAFAWLPVAAQEAPAFDRPGIGFATSVLPSGGFAWEQGLPDASTDEHDGLRTTTWVAGTLLRVGLPGSLELQLGADTVAGVRTHGWGVDDSSTGGGDGSVALKWAPATAGDDFAWALLASVVLPFGQAPVGDGGNGQSLAATASWTLAGDRSVSLFVERSWGEQGDGWLFSPSYGFALGEDVGGYVEAGIGGGDERQRMAGAGVTWMATSRLQLDASFLRGLGGDSPDWQAGIGLALYFAPH